MNVLNTLNTICSGWTSCGTLLCNPRPAGGIIDIAASGEWFVIFNDNRPAIEGLDTLDDVVEAFAAASCKEQTP